LKKLNDEKWRKVASKIRYCHGTSSKFQRSIEKYGLLPRKTNGVRPSVYKEHLESQHVDAVYLGTFNGKPYFCNIAAHNAVKAVGGEPVVFEVKLEPEDFKNFVKDEDSWAEDYTHLFKEACEFVREKPEQKGTVACYGSEVAKAIDEAVKEGILSEEEKCNPPPWFAEIACFGRFGIKGCIKPEKLKVWKEK